MDYNRLIKYTNPNFWIANKENKSQKANYRLKQDFKCLLTKYNLLQIKRELTNKLNSKFLELLNPISYNSYNAKVG